MASINSNSNERLPITLGDERHFQGVVVSSFSDIRVIPQLAKFPYFADRITATQDWDSPTYLHIGTEASDHACASVAKRYGFDVEVLLKIRNSR
jgi:hypothetical protein